MKKAVYVESVQAAAEYLDRTQGNVLLTTGSKELAGFTGMKDYKERLYARVLSCRTSCRHVPDWALRENI